MFDPQDNETLKHIFENPDCWRLNALYRTIGAPREDWPRLALNDNYPTTDPRDPRWETYLEYLRKLLHGSLSYRGTDLEQDVLCERMEFDTPSALRRWRELENMAALTRGAFDRRYLLDAAIRAADDEREPRDWPKHRAVRIETLHSLKIDGETYHDVRARVIIPHLHPCGTIGGSRLDTLIAMRGFELGLDIEDLDKLIDDTRHRIAFANHDIVDLTHDEREFFERDEVVDRLGLVAGHLRSAG